MSERISAPAESVALWGHSRQPHSLQTLTTLFASLFCNFAFFFVLVVAACVFFSLVHPCPPLHPHHIFHFSPPSENGGDGVGDWTEHFALLLFSLCASCSPFTIDQVTGARKRQHSCWHLSLPLSSTTRTPTPTPPPNPPYLYRSLFLNGAIHKYGLLCRVQPECLLVWTAGSTIWSAVMEHEWTTWLRVTMHKEPPTVIIIS